MQLLVPAVIVALSAGAFLWLMWRRRRRASVAREVPAGAARERPGADPLGAWRGSALGGGDVSPAGRQDLPPLQRALRRRRELLRARRQRAGDPQLIA